jgi:hypothetical protein
MEPVDPLKARFPGTDLYKVRRKKRSARDSRVEERADSKDETASRKRGRNIDELA